MSNDEHDHEIQTANTMRERSGESRIKIWLFLRTNRVLVTGLLALTFFVAFMGWSVGLAPSLQAELRDSDTIETLFSTMIGVVVTGTTLVVTINQLVLSQETGPLGDQRKRMADAMDFRTYASDLFGGVVPADPSAFLLKLVEETERRAEALDRLAAEGDNDEFASQVAALVDSLHGNAKEVEDQLEGAQFGTFDVLFAALNFNYSWKIFQIERLTQEFDSSLTDNQRTALDDLMTALAMFGPGREHIKTLYFQWELINLSQFILYAATPAVLIAGGMLTFVGAETFSGTVLSIPTVTWAVGVAFTITLIPFLLFTAYVLRIATLAKRTLAIGPLIPRESDR
jgi:hypothetical protein